MGKVSISVMNAQQEHQKQLIREEIFINQTFYEDPDYYASNFASSNEQISERNKHILQANKSWIILQGINRQLKDIN